MRGYRFLIFIIIIIAAGSLSFFFYRREEEFQLVPIEKRKDAIAGDVIGTEVGTGWSVNDNPEEAVKEAVEMALEGKKDKVPDFAVIFASSGSNLQAILTKVRELLGEEIKIFGGTSDSRAVMTDKGFVKVTERGYGFAEMEGKKGLAIMTVSSEDIVFGVGSANLSDFSSVQEASKTALLNAVEDSGKSQEESPRIICIMPTIGVEEEVVEGIEEITGIHTPILGGTAGGPKTGVLGKNRIYEKGVSLAVIYTDLMVGWTFEGGFDVTDAHAGVVTKVEGQAICEINNRPALDVYDEWLGGRINRLFEQAEKPDVIRDLLILHPIYRKYTSSDGQDYFLFSHPWPKDDTLKDKSIMTSTKIKPGELIYLSRGTWETLINRIGNLPRNAKIHGGIYVDKKPLFGIGFICGGVMGVIPEEERGKLPLLMGYTNNNAPFIAAFTWGEQGSFPGVGSKHGNLLTSFIVISEKE